MGILIFQSFTSRRSERLKKSGMIFNLSDFRNLKDLKIHKKKFPEKVKD